MTEPEFVRATRVAYDTVAEDYAELLQGELAANPFDRAMLDTFAELVPSDLPVADLGCGPGRITAYLHELGCDAFGIDLSPAMVAVARRAYPDLRFDVGTLTATALGDGAAGGVVAWYSIIHTPPEQLPEIVAEFRRVLCPGGHLLLAFQAGNERVALTNAYGDDIALDAYRLAPDAINAMLQHAGFTVIAQLLREPLEREKTQQAYVLAQVS